jgi:hypothetical protein
MDNRFFQVTVVVAVPDYCFSDTFGGNSQYSGADFIEAAGDATILDMESFDMELLPVTK